MILLYNRTNRISLFCILLQNVFLAKINQVENKCFEWLSRLYNFFSRVHKKWCLQNFCLIKKWVMVEIIDKNFVFFSFYMVHKKYGLWKVKLESWNMNHESLSRTLIHNYFFAFWVSNCSNTKRDQSSVKYKHF